MSPYRAGSPRTLNEALSFLAEIPDLVIAAGCTDLMVADLESRARQTHVMSVLYIEELQGIARDGEDLRIGAAATFTEIGSSEEVKQAFPILARAAQLIGGWQIQNRATIGGNIVNASPAGDSLPVLLALDAKVEIAGQTGRRLVAYDAMHVGYRKTALGRGEILAAVRIPMASAQRIQAFRKVGPRAAQAISKVVVAMSGRRENGAFRQVRVAAGSVAEIPLRLKRAEAALEGRPVQDAAAKAGETAAGEVTPIDDVRSTAHYRSWVLARIVERMAQEMEERSR
jgi:CO/xanthine dehydrogenase FAD-binding subunit